eukprot:366474-Chlamydomonas_euryale.AAC.25
MDTSKLADVTTKAVAALGRQLGHHSRALTAQSPYLSCSWMTAVGMSVSEIETGSHVLMLRSLGHRASRLLGVASPSTLTNITEMAETLVSLEYFDVPRSRDASYRSSAAAMLSSQAGSVQLVNNFGNVLLRLPVSITHFSTTPVRHPPDHFRACWRCSQALSDPKNYAGLADDAGEEEHLSCALLAGTAKSAHTVLERLNGIMEELAGVVRQQERLCLDALAALGPAPDVHVVAAPAGSTLSPAQMVEAVEDSWWV